MCSTELVNDAASDGPSSTTSTTPTPVNSISNSNNNGPITKMPDTTIRNPNRRSNKPIMEKRRRARINNCLNELKAILLEAMRKDPARHSKLEKADILELTVSHLKSLHRNTLNGNSSNCNNVDLHARFRAGFSECINEVGRFLTTCSTAKSENFTSSVTTRLLNHLAECLGNSSMLMAMSSTSSNTSVNSASGNIMNNNNSVFNMKFEDRIGGGLEGVTTSTSASTPSTFNMSPNTPIISLVPSRLPSGQIAFVVPGGCFNSSNIQVMSSASSPLDNNNNNHNSSNSSTGFVSSSIPSSNSNNYTPHQLRHHPMLLSPEVPLELTVSPPTISPAAQPSIRQSISPYSGHVNKTSFFQHARQQQFPNVHQLPPPPTAHYHGYQMPMSRHEPDYFGQQPLSLVTPKREHPDENCWRPW